MSLSLEQVWTYLNRIRFPLTDRLPRPDYSTLCLVHELHARFVIFENLSLLVPSWRSQDVLNTGLKIDVPSLYNKIVARGRGGYCFELNTAFGALLTGMGYTVRHGAARVVMDGLEVDPQAAAGHVYLMTPHSHMVLFVTGGMLPLGVTYLCDAGLGGNTLTKPVEVPARDVAAATTGSSDPPTNRNVFSYRLRWGKCGTTAPAQANDVDQGYYLQVWANRSPTLGAWHDLYYFTLAPFGPMDFAAQNFFTSLYPQSLFLKGPFCSRPDDKGGRYILMNGILKYRDCTGQSQTQTITSSAELATALRAHFGLEVPMNEVPGASNGP